MSTSDQTGSSPSDPSTSESTSKLPAFGADSSGSAPGAPVPVPGSPVAETSSPVPEAALDGKGSASRGASRSPVREPAEDSASAERRGPRRVRLTLSRIDPFSAMKLSFLLAIGIGIATVVATILLWNLVDAIGLWERLDSLARDLNGGDPLPFMDFFEFSRMTSYATIVAVVNIVLITAIGTLFSFLYNLVAALLGGLKMTFTDE